MPTEMTWNNEHAQTARKLYIGLCARSDRSIPIHSELAVLKAIF